MVDAVAATVAAAVAAGDRAGKRPIISLIIRHSHFDGAAEQIGGIELTLPVDYSFAALVFWYLGEFMAGRGPQTFKKRQKEQARKEKQQEKIAKRLERKQGGESVADDDQIESPAETAARLEIERSLERS